MEFISGTKQHKQFLQINDKLYKGMELPKKISDLPLNTETIQQTHKIMMDGENILVGDIESHLYLQVIIFLHRPASLKDILKKQFLDFMKLKRMIQL